MDFVAIILTSVLYKHIFFYPQGVYETLLLQHMYTHLSCVTYKQISGASYDLLHLFNFLCVSMGTPASSHKHYITVDLLYTRPRLYVYNLNDIASSLLIRDIKNGKLFRVLIIA